MIHILIIDADKTLRGTYAKALEKAGYSVAVAPSAQAAIGLCEEHIPDVIVLELQLQGHSGVEFLHELRSYPEWLHIPVLLQTLVPSKDLDGFEKAFKSMGIAGYAYKPETTLKKLVDIISDTVQIKR